VQSTQLGPQWSPSLHTRQVFPSHHSPEPPLQSPEMLQSTHAAPSERQTSPDEVQSVHVVPHSELVSQITHEPPTQRWPEPPLHWECPVHWAHSYSEPVQRQ